MVWLRSMHQREICMVVYARSDERLDDIDFASSQKGEERRLALVQLLSLCMLHSLQSSPRFQN